MSLGELLIKNCKDKSVSFNTLAKNLGVPVEFLLYIENPEQAESELIALFAQALELSVEEFKGEAPPKPKEPTPEEQRAALLLDARFPAIRKYILNPHLCKDVDTAMKYLNNQALSLVEQNIILYMSTNALYHFCDTNSSNFAFDEYLFKLHNALRTKFEQDLLKMELPEQEKEELLVNARINVFGCDSMENIAIRIMEPFAQELENKLNDFIYDFELECELPFTWAIDEPLKKIIIKDNEGVVRDQLKLLDVKTRKTKES